MLQRLDNLFGHIHASAIGIHIEHDSPCTGGGRFFEAAADQVERVVGNIFPDRDDANGRRFRACTEWREQSQRDA